MPVREAPLLSVLIAALDEGSTLGSVIPRVLDVPVALEIVMVDDGSTDDTWAVMQRFVDGRRVRAYRHDRRKGKGAAIRTALEHARGTYVIIQDADDEYDPADYVRVLEPLLSRRAQVVYGTRMFAGHTAYSYWYVMGNRGVTQMANMLYNVYLSDIQTAYKVFPREAAQAMDLQATGFEIDPEITAKLLRLGYRIHEVPVSYVARTRDQGKKVKPSDGVRALMTLGRYRVWRPRPGTALRSLSGGSELGSEVRSRVDRHAVEPDLEVHVGPRRPTG